MHMAIESKYDVLSVCRHVVNYCNENNLYIDNLKLQKLLYFIQAQFLFESNGREACFREEIVAWPYGPVVVEAYEEFKIFGSSIIPEVHYITELNTETWEFEKVSFIDPLIGNGRDTALVDKTVNDLRVYSSTDLVNLTHNQAPWVDAYEKGTHTPIPKDAIYRFFKN